MSDSSTQPRANKQSGQGIVEYVLILLLITVVVVVFLVLLGPTVQNLFDPNSLENPCRTIGGSDSFQCLDYKVNQCLASEKYTKDQCVELVGSK